MPTKLTATVKQEGKFFKVITSTGKDISAQIERPMRKRAIELGKELEFDEVKNVWKIQGEKEGVAPAVVTQKERTTPKPETLDKLEEILMTDAGKKKRKRKVYTLVEMEKPTYKVGSKVEIDFLGKRYTVKLTKLDKNPTNTNRWVYDGECVKTGLKIPFIGIGDTEEWANIIVEEN